MNFRIPDAGISVSSLSSGAYDNEGDARAKTK